MSARAVAAAFALWLATVLAPAAAQERVVVYRCTDAAGHVTVQNDTPCPAGARQQRSIIEAPPALPAYVPREQRMPEVVAAEQSRQATRIDGEVPRPVPPGERKPPPPLYECTTWDEVHYLTDDAEPRRHCAPLQVVGIAGRTPAASACEQVADTCTAVPADALCRGWKRRVDEAEFRWKFAGAAEDDGKRLEYETLRATWENSTCNPAGRAQNP
jgi:hypothetical protein